MDRTKKDNAEEGVAGVAGLVGIRSDRYYYVGKIDWPKMNDGAVGLAGGTPADTLAYTGGYVALKDAYEMLVQHTPEGPKVGAVPIAPFTEATSIVVRVDSWVDLSKEPWLVNVDRAMTGRSGILLPGGLSSAGR